MKEKLREVVEKNQNKIAYIVGDKSITYKELWDKANIYGDLLKREGNSPVILYGQKEIEMVIAILACIISGRAYVPLGLCTPLFRIKKIIEMTKSSIMITGEKINIEGINVSNLEGLHKYANNEINDNDNDIIYIIFTSGSTGEPKGVPISKKNLSNFVNWISKIKPLCDYKSISVLNTASFSFDLSVADFYYSLCNGHTLVAFNDDVNDQYDILFDLFKNIDVAVMTPTFMKLLLINNYFTEENYPRFKCVYFCGEQLEIKTVEKVFKAFPNICIINAYGPTEATSAVSGIQITKEMLNYDLIPVGEINNFATDIKIVNNEIVLKGDSVFNGYLNIKENIKEYHTGDIGFIKDGLLYCKGRKDNQVKYKGYRIELNDIEHNISMIKGVEECAVIVKYDNEIVKTIKAFVVGKVDNKYVKEELSKMLPSYMIPKSIVIIDKLPVNQNGKIDRKALCNI